MVRSYAHLDGIYPEQLALLRRQVGSLRRGAALQEVDHAPRSPCRHLCERGAVEQRVVQIQHQAQLALPAQGHQQSAQGQPGEMGGKASGYHEGKCEEHAAVQQPALELAICAARGLLPDRLLKSQSDGDIQLPASDAFLKTARALPT